MQAPNLCVRECTYKSFSAAETVVFPAMLPPSILHDLDLMNGLKNMKTFGGFLNNNLGRRDVFNFLPGC